MFYVVWVGRYPGVYSSWEECEAQVKGFPGARFRSFGDRATALSAFASNEDLFAVDADRGPQPESCAVGTFKSNHNSDIGYIGVATGTGDKLFQVSTLPNSTNNIGAFLAVCHALAFCAERGLETPIYSDSQTALAWIRHRKCGSALTRTAANLKTFDLVNRAERWLASHDWRNSVLQWNTKAWGPIPANFKRMNHGYRKQA